MQKILGACAAICLTTIVSLPANAADLDGNYSVEGVGQISCQTFTKSRQNASTDQSASNEYGLFLGFITGYVSAYNRFVDDTFDLTPWQGLELFARAALQFCSKNPEQNFFVAVSSVTSSLVDQRLREQSPIVTTKQGDQDITIYREVIARAQRKLKQLDFYQGQADGDYGPQTISAIKAFQQSIKTLEPNGLPDQATLLVLFAQ
ncbi:MAG: peptidoglycan-binding protein [Pseudomonadota bacterium]